MSTPFYRYRSKAKYGAKRVENDGYSFASKGEASCYQFLKLRERAGEIKILQTQVQVRLSDAEIVYKPDFLIQDLSTGEEIYIEYKGFETPEWRIKRRLWKAYGPGPLHVYKGRMQLSEVILPEGYTKPDPNQIDLEDYLKPGMGEETK